jgi:hypothetical protein
MEFKDPCSCFSLLFSLSLSIYLSRSDTHTKTCAVTFYQHFKRIHLHVRAEDSHRAPLVCTDWIIREDFFLYRVITLALFLQLNLHKCTRDCSSRAFDNSKA